MARTLIACAVSAVIAAAVTASVGLGARSGNWMRTVPVPGTALFAGQDLICVNEPASGDPRFHVSGVACSSYAQPYRGIGFWFTRTAVKVTRPPNGKVIATLGR